MLIVQKYGGTSVGSVERIRAVAERVKRAADAGNQVVAVVSAMSGETNKLIALAAEFSKTPSTREMDMLLSSGERVTSALLAIALTEMGYEAIALTGRQAGIVTDSVHTKARIEEIPAEPVMAQIKAGKIVVIAGFQGVTREGEVTTLGRGGSDLTAVAIAGAIKADLCEIYTDVDGVYTTDPRIEDKAKKLDKISYEEMLELASLGAKVLQNRSVELAKKLSVKVVTRNSFNENKGTTITSEEECMEKPIVSGVALDKNQARVSLIGIADRPGIAAEIFGALANAAINVDMIVQTVGQDGKTNLDFTIPATELETARKSLEGFGGALGRQEFDNEVCKLSIVGVGMKSHSGVAAEMFAALAKENINILMISTSEIKISVVVAKKYGELAVRILHATYELDK
ncbi:MAG: aspartate kinase [Helicobacteraceae bacterium]|jgi:aspartate kinase|nr:aspartate kinase [Helicobacteraceae bacterium]